MWRQRKMEEMRDAIVELMKDPQFLSQYLPKKKAAPAQNNPGALPGAVPGAGGEMPGEMPGAVPGAGGEMPGEMPGAVPGGEQLPQTDAMIPGQERM